MTNDDLLRTPGEILREARDRAGLTLDALAERTRIAPAMLAAVEKDEYHLVSDPLYVKSFLRAYAAEVGLDPDEVLDVYARVMGGRVAGPTDAEGVWEEQSVTINRVGLPWGRILPVAGAAVVVLVAVVLLVRGCGGDPEQLPTPNETPQVAVQETLPVSAVTEEEILAEPETEPATTPVPTDPPPVRVQVPTVSPTLPAAPDATPALRLVGTGGGDLVLRVLATVPTRVSVRRDGEAGYRTMTLGGAGGNDPLLDREDIDAGRAYTVREGSVAYWRAHDHFSLKLDRIEGVSVNLNGRERDLVRLRPGQEMILDAHAGGE